MAEAPGGAILRTMLRSSTSPRLLLVADRRQPTSDLGQLAVRRFRLARVQMRGRPAGAPRDQPLPSRYAGAMARDLEPSRSRPPILKKAAAGVVLLVVAALAIHVIIGV